MYYYFRNGTMKKHFLLFFFVGLVIFGVGTYIYFSPWFSDEYTPSPEEISEVVNLENEEDILGAQAPGTVKIPVLMYHNIGSVPTRGSYNYRGLYVSPSMFEKQMKYLKSNGYKTLTPEEFYTILESGKNPEQKSVLITFDDGSRGQYKYAYPILKKLKMTATFYIISDKSPITKKELREMSKNGMVIDSHTSTHKDLKKLKGDKNFKYQLVTSKRSLEEVTGKEIVSIAYPGCVADSRTFSIVERKGYKLGFACGRSIYHTYKNRFNLSRVHIYSNMESFKRAITKGL